MPGYTQEVQQSKDRGDCSTDQPNADQPPCTVYKPRQMTRSRPGEDVKDQGRHERADRQWHNERVKRMPRRPGKR